MQLENGRRVHINIRHIHAKSLNIYGHAHMYIYIPSIFFLSLPRTAPHAGQSVFDLESSNLFQPKRRSLLAWPSRLSLQMHCQG